MMSKINLDGGETSIIRTPGFSSAPMPGRVEDPDKTVCAANKF